MQAASLALSFAEFNAGNSNDARIAMIAMTTNSSISVNLPDGGRQSDLRLQRTIAGEWFGAVLSRQPIVVRFSPCTESLVFGMAVSAVKQEALSHIRAFFVQSLR